MSWRVRSTGGPGGVRTRGTGGGVRIRSAGPPPPFSPDSLPGLLAWYKSDALVGLSDGDVVASLPNSAGLSAYDMGAAWGNIYSRRYVASDPKFGGLPSLHVDQGLLTSNPSAYNYNGTCPAPGSSPFTFYFVGTQISRDSMSIAGFGDSAGGYGYMHRFDVYNYNGSIGVETNGALICGSNDRPGGDVPFLFSFAYTAGSNLNTNKTYINGILSYGGVPGSPGDLGSGGVPLDLGGGTGGKGGVALGCAPGFLDGGGMWHGYFAEMLIYDSAHGDATRSQVEDYLKAKWGVA
jgi:hypothetical protein